MQVLLLFEIFLLVWSATGSFENEMRNRENSEFCSSLSSTKMNIVTLPSDRQILTCKCSGVAKPQACPRWNILTSSQYFFVEYPNANQGENSCNSFLLLKLKTASVPQDLESTTIKYRCESIGNRRLDGQLTIKKAKHTSVCNEDEDCFLKNQKCLSRGNCTGTHCVKECNCPHNSVYIEDSLENCYIKSYYGEPCTIREQCLADNADLVCASSDGNDENDNNRNHTVSHGSGQCKCPSGLIFNRDNQECIVDDSKGEGLSLTTRVLIAVACGVAGIGIIILGCVCLRMRNRDRPQTTKQRKDVDLVDDPSAMIPLQAPQIPERPPRKATQIPEDTQEPEDNQESLPPYAEHDQNDDQDNQAQDPTNIEVVVDPPKQDKRLEEPV